MQESFAIVTFRGEIVEIGKKLHKLCNFYKGDASDLLKDVLSFIRIDSSKETLASSIGRNFSLRHNEVYGEAKLDAVGEDHVLIKISLNPKTIPFDIEEFNFSNILNSIHDVIWVSEIKENKMLFLSDSAEAMYKQKKEFLMQSPMFWFDSILEEDKPKKETAMQILERDGQSTCVYRILDGEGNIKWILDNIDVWVNGNNKPNYYVGVASNITAQMEHEGFLSDRQAQADIAMRQGGVGFWDMDFKTAKSNMQDSWVHMLGYEEGEFEGHFEDYKSLVHPKDWERILPTLREVNEGKRTEFSLDFRMKRKAGDWIWVREIGKIVEGDVEGLPLRGVGLFIDIDQQMKAQERLNEMLAQLRVQMKNTPLAILETEENFEITYFNEMAADLFEDFAMEGVRLKKFLDPATFLQLKEFMENLKRFKEYSGQLELTLTLNDQTELFTEWHISLLKKRNGDFRYFFVINDLTVRYHVEKARWSGQQEERKRISRDIHDSLGQQLVALKFQLNSLHSDDFDKNTVKKLLQLENSIEQLISETRRISSNLAPREVTQGNLEAMVSTFCERVKTSTGLNVNFSFMGEFSTLREDEKENIFRIAQESISNILKHSKARNVDVFLRNSKRNLMLKIADDGEGFNVEERKGKGNGLLNMEERAHLAGGTLQILSIPQEGTILVFNKPLLYEGSN